MITCVIISLERPLDASGANHGIVSGGIARLVENELKALETADVKSAGVRVALVAPLVRDGVLLRSSSETSARSVMSFCTGVLYEETHRAEVVRNVRYSLDSLFARYASEPFVLYCHGFKTLDVVHAALRAARLCSKPTLVVRPHIVALDAIEEESDDAEANYRRLHYLEAKHIRTSHVVTNTYAERRRYLSAFPDLLSDQVHVISPAVENPRSTATILGREQRRRERKHVVLGMFGRLHDSQKQIHVAIESWAQLRRCAPEIRWTFLGAGGALRVSEQSIAVVETRLTEGRESSTRTGQLSYIRGVARSLVERFSPAERRDFVLMSPQSADHFFSLIDIHVCVSSHETFHYATAEALARGVPTVLPRIPALVELYKEFEDMSLVSFFREKADSLEIADCVRRFLKQLAAARSCDTRSRLESASFWQDRSPASVGKSLLNCIVRVAL